MVWQQAVVKRAKVSPNPNHNRNRNPNPNQALAEAELFELRSSLASREEQLEAVKQAAAMQGITDQQQAV